MTYLENKGFTLVETLVAITILVIAIVGPLYAVHRAVTASYTARDTLTATALAQEGMEFVRNARDTNYLTGQNNWLHGLSTCMINGPSDHGCGPDMINGSLENCDESGCSPLRLDTSYRYRQGESGTPTRFTRRVTITTVPSSDIEVVEVVVQVSWTTLRIPYTFTVTEHLYNWQ